MPPATPPEPASSDRSAVCPRCAAGFACGRASERCWCADVTLDGAVRADIARFYDGCLCPDCLRVVEDARPPRPDVWRYLLGGLRRSRR